MPAQPKTVYAFWNFKSLENRAADMAFEAESLVKAAEALKATLGKSIGWNAWWITFPSSVFRKPSTYRERQILQAAGSSPETLVYLIPGMRPGELESYVFLEPGRNESNPCTLCEVRLTEIRSFSQKAPVSSQD